MVAMIMCVTWAEGTLNHAFVLTYMYFLLSTALGTCTCMYMGQWVTFGCLKAKMLSIGSIVASAYAKHYC